MKDLSFRALPVSEYDEERIRFSALLNAMLLSVMAGAIIYMMALPIMDPNLTYRIVIFVPIFPLCFALYILIRKDYFKIAAFLLTMLIWVILTVAAITSGGVRAPAFNGYIIVVLIAGLLLGGEVAMGFAILSILSGVGLFLAEVNGLLPVAFIPTTSFWFLGSEILYFLMGGIVLYLAARHLNRALERARHNEEALHASETRYRVASELTSDYTYSARILSDQRIMFDWVNGAFTRITGIVAGDILNQADSTTLIHPDDLSILYEPEKVIANDKLVAREYRLITHDGQIRWVRSHVQPVWSASAGSAGAEEKNRLVRIYGAAQDITEQREAQLALRQSEEKLRSVVENVPDFIATVDRDGQVLYINNVLPNFDKEDVLGTTIYHYILPEYHLMVSNTLAGVFQHGEADSYETAGFGPNGEIVWYTSRVSPIKHDDEVVAVTLISTDITSRKIGEETLRESESRYRSLFEDSPISLWEEDFSEVKRYIESLRKRGISDFRAYFDEHPEAVIYCTKLVKILDCNQASIDLFEADNKERLCGRLDKITRKDTLDIFKEEIVVLAEGKTKFEIEAVQQTLTGKKIQVVMRCSVAPNYEDSWAKVFVSVIDITDRKMSEEALAQERASLAQRVEERTAELSAANAELARAARLKDEFLANMSHELRTPLNAILGMSKVLNRQIYGPLNEEQLKSLGYIHDSGRHLLALINDILDLSKIEAGKAQLKIRSVLVADVCQASLLFIKQMAHKKQLNVSSTLDHRIDTVMVDQRRLKQILVNLLSNAVKFTPAGGEIGLEVQADQVRNVVKFIVWDTGIGISKEDSKRLFKPFVQIDSSLSRQHEGTGLGLSLVYRLTEMHGGSVQLESEVDKGSRFTISIPWHKHDADASAGGYRACRDAAAAARQVSAKMQHNGLLQTATTSQALILLAEDNDANIMTIQSFLKISNYRLIVARNGAEAIKRAREEKPNLILMDIQMPTMDGLEAMRRLRASSNSTLAQIPIIALTALAMPGDRERCLQAGANDYLSKPVDLDGLIEAIEAQLQKTNNMASS